MKTKTILLLALLFVALTACKDSYAPETNQPKAQETPKATAPPQRGSSDIDAFKHLPDRVKNIPPLFISEPVLWDNIEIKLSKEEKQALIDKISEKNKQWFDLLLPSSFHVIDYNNDQKPDILFSGAFGEGCATILFRNETDSLRRQAWLYGEVAEIMSLNPLTIKLWSYACCETPVDEIAIYSLQNKANRKADYSYFSNKENNYEINSYPNLQPDSILTYVARPGGLLPNQINKPIAGSLKTDSRLRTVPVDSVSPGQDGLIAAIIVKDGQEIVYPSAEIASLKAGQKVYILNQFIANGELYYFVAANATKKTLKSPSALLNNRRLAYILGWIPANAVE